MAKAMKDSGVAWIGEIPDGWKIRRIKTLFKLRDEKNYKPLSEVNLISLYTDKGVMQHSDIEYFAGNKASNADGYKCVYENDIVVNIILCWMGAIGRSAYNGVTSPAYDVYFPLSFVNSNYYHYLFRTNGFNGECFKRGRGIMLMRWRTYSDDFSNISVPFPPLPQQQSIANFLDKKCSEVDSLLTKIIESIEEYKKLRQSIITQAVTKGIRPNRKMKDSGIEWIGKIPEEWAIEPLTNSFSFGKGLPITKENLEETGIPVISYGQIHGKYNHGTRLVEPLFRYVNESYLQTNPQCLVHENDLIVADTSEDLEGCGNSVYVDKEMSLFAGYHTVILFSKNNTSKKFFSYLLKTDIWRSQIRAGMIEVKVYSVSRKLLKKTDLIVPSIDEQKEISDYLDKKCSEIDNLIAKKEQLIPELESYKKSLIYEYVTGKKEVK